MTVTRYTNAPETYDGFGTMTVEVLNVTFRNGSDHYRQVQIAEDALDWQTGRYRSGMYPVLDQAAFDDQYTAGILRHVRS